MLISFRKSEINLNKNGTNSPMKPNRDEIQDQDMEEKNKIFDLNYDYNPKSRSEAIHFGLDQIQTGCKT